MAHDSTALTRVDQTSTELALPADLIGKARNYAASSRSKRTLKEYAYWWNRFDQWCADNGRDSLPCGTDTLGAYLTWLADGGFKPGKTMAISTIQMALSAIRFRHRSIGHALDTGDPHIQAIVGGIRREIAQKRSVRRVKPLTFDLLKEMIDLLRLDQPREAQDAAILALGSAGALRRIELIGLDYAELGTSKDDERKGFIAISEEGIKITLMTSKSSQDTAVEIVIPRKEARTLVETVENWIKVGNVQVGAPIFRGVRGRGWSTNKQSQYPGVSWDAPMNKWRAQANKKNLGRFEDEYAAYVAYCKACSRKPKSQDKAPSFDYGKRHRINTAFVAHVVKRRVRMLMEDRATQKGRKKPSKEEIMAAVASFAGHSMRAGYATSAAQNDVPTHRIKAHTRHKSDAMLGIYIREVDRVKNSGLKGVGF